MISSMTGHARFSGQFRQHEIVFEVKSVNNRFKEIRWRAPSEMMPFTFELKAIVDHYFQRGSFDFAINFVGKSAASGVQINWDLARNFLQDFQRELNVTSERLSLAPTDFLRNEFTNEQSDLRDIEKAQLKDYFARLLEELKKSRQLEGQSLQRIVLQHFENIAKELEVVKLARNQLKEHYQQKLTDVLKKATEATELSEEQQRRVWQECAFMLEKYDVDEEINRLESHLHSVQQILRGEEQKVNEAIGKKLEFFVQECHREINTLGSKSQRLEMTKCVVEMKCELEKIREQILNIE